jgi:hypothetical protein
MTDEEFKKLKVEIDEVGALRDNLKATQDRCSQLLNESRGLAKELANSESANAALIRLVGQLETELNDLRGANILRRE